MFHYYFPSLHNHPVSSFSLCVFLPLCFFFRNSDKVLSVFDGALQKAAVSSLTERSTKLIDEGFIEVNALIIW